MNWTDGLKTIVVATDLHGQCEAALEYAGKLAHAYGARIVLAHGADPLDYAAVERVPGGLMGKLSQPARDVLGKLSADLLREGIPSHSEIRQGAVTDMLVDVAVQYQAGLIVIGTKGKEGAGPVVVGAIAEALVRRAPCPVMAVAADWNAGPHRPTPGGPVLLTIEQNEAAHEAAEAAYSLAATFGRPLFLLHVRSAAEVVAFLNPCATRLEDFGVHPTANVVVHCLVKDGDPIEAVEQAILQHHPCVLVAGAKRSSQTPGPHGTAFALLARSRVPVLCVPPADHSGPARETAAAVEV